MPEIGPLFLIALDGKTPSPEEREAISRYGLKHFIFFSRNLGSFKETKALLKELELLAGEGLRAIDQEGGPVCRLRPPHFPPLSAPRRLALAPAPQEAVAKEARLCARELRRWGFNLNLSPVLDLAGEEAPVFLKDRTFGKDPYLVAALAETYIETFKKEGLLCCAKHFPGLSGVKDDPHLKLPVKEGVGEKDLIPFRRAVATGVPAVMTTHLLVPAWDGEPVTFSSRAIAFLRRELGFGGLILSDDLFMGGALSRAGLEEAVLKAFLAGHDLLLLCGEFTRSLEALAAFAEEVKKSAVLRKKVAEKFSFIEKQMQIFKIHAKRRFR